MQVCIHTHKHPHIQTRLPPWIRSFSHRHASTYTKHHSLPTLSFEWKQRERLVCPKAASTDLLALRLDGSRVYSCVMQHFLDFPGNIFILSHVVAAHVCRGNDATASQLPYMELMYRNNSLHLKIQQQVSEA